MPENQLLSHAIAYLSLGSNLGNRQEQLQQAINLLRSYPFIASIQSSSVYQTKPFGPVEQPPYWNLCLKIVLNETILSTHNMGDRESNINCRSQRCAELLLEYCLQCEQQLGRKRTGQQSRCRWGPRTIDIDIIDYNRLPLSSANLDLPHPYFLQRLFVLVPLMEIADRDFCDAYSLYSRIEYLKTQEPDWGARVHSIIT